MGAIQARCRLFGRKSLFQADTLFVLQMSALSVHARRQLARRSRSALAMTETELRLIASAAIIGDRSFPVNG